MRFSPEQIDIIDGWLKTPTFLDVFAALEETFTAEWKAASTEAERERCWQGIQFLGRVLDAMKMIVSTEKVDEFNRERARVSDWSPPKPLVE